VSRLKDWAISLMLGRQQAATAEEIAAAIERAGAVGRPPRLVASGRLALIDEVRRDQAAQDARIARQVGHA
jgi:hypothetical protein